jgi:antitoxin component YwqK of YwqJK toxin-antitoxin module
MKQVCILSLFVSIAYALPAQNISPANQFATTISETRLPLLTTINELPVVAPAPGIEPHAYFFGEKVRGTWMSFYSNGNRCDSGFLLNNMPDGLWKSWYPNGQLRVQMHCSAKKLASAKDEMERLYKPGFSPGPHMREMRQLVVNSPYPYDKLIYRQLYIATHSQEKDEIYEAVQVNVHSGDHIKSFQTELPPFTECMVHGVYKTWFENGLLKDSGYCDNGVREGVWVEYDENSKMRAVGFYRNGLRFKDWRFYNMEGKLQFIRWYNRQEEITQTIALRK